LLEDLEGHATAAVGAVGALKKPTNAPPATAPRWKAAAAKRNDWRGSGQRERMQRIHQTK